MNNKPKKLLIAAGGTGGHFYPALVLADYWQKKYGPGSVHLVFRQNEHFRRLLTEKKISASALTITGLKRKISFQLFSYPFIILRALIESWRIIHKFQPDYLIGFGSYLSFPVVLAGFFSRIPIYLHEQNCLPGLANRCLAVLAKKIFISFAASSDYFPRRKTILSGYPIRPEIRAISRSASEPEPKTWLNILILGGSQGASSINQAIQQVFIQEKSIGPKVKIIHLTGEKDFSVMENFYREHNITAEVYPYFENIAELYRRSDLVISRAGAGTVAELFFLSLPAILIPYPSATARHQTLNARLLTAVGPGYILEETGNWTERLARKVKEFVLDQKLWYNRKIKELPEIPEEIIVKNITEK